MWPCVGWKPSRGYKEKDKIGLLKVSLWLLHGWAVTGEDGARKAGSKRRGLR